MLPSCDTSRGGVKPEPWYSKGEAGRYEEKEEQLILVGILEGLKENQNIVLDQERACNRKKEWPDIFSLYLAFLKKTSPACKQVLKMFKTN